MSKAPLPNKLDPRRSADQGVSYEHCSLQLSRLNRLAEYLVDTDGEIDVSLYFGVDEERLRYLKGTADVQVRMLCQRCLEPVELELNAELNLGIVSSEEAAKNLPRYYDPLLVTDNELDPAQAVEDELILTLPLIPTHQSCEIKTEFVAPEGAAAGDEKENPFSILAQLKGNKH